MWKNLIPINPQMSYYTSIVQFIAIYCLLICLIMVLDTKDKVLDILEIDSRNIFYETFNELKL